MILTNDNLNLAKELTERWIHEIELNLEILEEMVPHGMRDQMRKEYEKSMIQAKNLQLHLKAELNER